MPYRTMTLAALLAAAGAGRANACPFCAAESRTLSEEIADSSVVLLGKLAAAAEAGDRLRDSGVPAGLVDPETGSATFDVVKVLVGKPFMEGVEQIQAIYFGEPDLERKYFISGVGSPPDWAVPLPLSDVAAEYVPKLLELPPAGAERLAFFQQYLQHEDALLAQDAYDEFARAPYQDVVDLGPQMDRRQLMAWVEDPLTSPSRRRLFLTMLGVCGEPKDLEQLREMLASDSRRLASLAEGGAAAAISVNPWMPVAFQPEAIRIAERQRKLGLDALIACYLTLAGKHGDPVEALDLVDRRFLADPKADYSNVYAALQALRFLAEEQTELVPLPRILQSARLLLSNPQFADQVIPDLARWEDWTLVDRLEQMYRESFEDREDAPVKYVREPIITYLDVAAGQSGEVGESAEAALAKIEELDPKTVERARSLQAFGMLGAARARQVDAAEEFVAAQKSRAESPGGGERTTVASAGPDEMPPNPIETPLPRAAGGDRRDVNPQVSQAEASDPRAVAAEPEAGPAAPASGTPESDPSRAAAKTPAGPPAVAGRPSQTVLVGVPLLGAAALVGLFWLILRGGVA
ncbi:hypothetical protein [Botrimarina sp.]|uniref:hypothetical protein n=1 Tax=Botrimarina sp. TaxID=2795802 RepID=UPI0032EAEAA5